MKFRPAYLFVLALALSCGRGNPALHQAARVIEDHPDSALYILDGVSRVDLATEREKAEYDFLSAEARTVRLEGRQLGLEVLSGGQVAFVFGLLFL